MNRIWRRKRSRPADERHRRILSETSQWLTECMRHPELAVRIPTVPAGSARFPRSLCVAFWSPILFE